MQSPVRVLLCLRTAGRWAPRGPGAASVSAFEGERSLVAAALCGVRGSTRGPSGLPGANVRTRRVARSGARKPCLESTDLGSLAAGGGPARARSRRRSVAGAGAPPAGAQVGDRATRGTTDAGAALRLVRRDGGAGRPHREAGAGR